MERQSAEKSKRSSIEQYLPKYRKHRKQPKQKQRVQNYSQMVEQVENAICKIEQFMDERMRVHENQLIHVLKQEVHVMLEDVKKVVEEYNRVLEEKSYSSEVIRLRNQLEYFKYESVKLFESNNQLKKQLNLLKQNYFSISCELKAKGQALFDITRKLEKNKTRANHKQRHNSQNQIKSTKPTKLQLDNQHSKSLEKDAPQSSKQTKTTNYFQTNKSLEQSRFPALFGQSQKNKFIFGGIGKIKNHEEEGPSEAVKTSNDYVERTQKNCQYVIEEEQYEDQHMKKGFSEQILAGKRNLKRRKKLIKYRLCIPVQNYQE